MVEFGRGEGLELESPRMAYSSLRNGDLTFCQRIVIG